jgi:L-asparaginase
MSGVINEEVKNPVQVAQILMQYDDRVLGGSGVSHGKMVLNHFLQKFHNVVQNMKKLKSSTGTVGCVAFDQNGK